MEVMRTLEVLCLAHLKCFEKFNLKQNTFMKNSSVDVQVLETLECYLSTLE